MGKLSETILDIKQPEYNDEMIERLINVYNTRDSQQNFYKKVQFENGLSDASRIDRTQEKEFFQKYTPGYKQGNSFQHMGSMSDIEYCFGRLYINCSKQDIFNLSELFIEACKERELPYYFKYSSKENSNRADQFVIYSNAGCLQEYIEILRDIKEKNPQMADRCGMPPILTGTLDGWIGIGEEPKANDKSYTGVRTDIIEKILSSEVDKTDYEEIRRLISIEFEKEGLSIESSCFDKEKMGIMQNESKITSFDKEKKQKIRENKTKRIERTKEKEVLKKMSILKRLDILPEEFNNVYEASTQRRGFLADLTKNSNFSEAYSFGQIIETNEGIKKWNYGPTRDELSTQEKDEVKTKMLKDLVDFYTDYFENSFDTIDDDIHRYEELMDLSIEQDTERNIEKVDLYSKLNFLSGSKALFEYIGIPDERLEQLVSKASLSLESKQENNKEDLDKHKHDIDLEFVQTVLEETFDKSELSDIDNMEKSQKELILNFIKEEGISLSEVKSIYNDLGKDLNPDKSISK